MVNIRYNIFRHRLQDERKRVGLSQEELGSRINRTRQTISKWENGTGNAFPDVHDLENLCDIFGCDYGYLVGDYDYRHKEVVDLKNCIGLEGPAIDKLKSLKEDTSSQIPALSEGSIEMLNLYSNFIGNLELSGVLNALFWEIRLINSHGLSDAQRESFSSEESAIKYYENQIQNEVASFIHNFILHEKRVNNGSDTQTKE